MFFRLKATKSGQVLKLVESYRDDTGKPRHRKVASLGDAPITRAQWKPIAKAVEDRLYGREVLLERELSETERGWVDRIVRQVSTEGEWSPLRPPEDRGEPIEGVLAAEVTHTETAELGPALVGWEIWKRLGMPEQLGVLGLNGAQRKAAAISVINRLVDPVSEHRLLDWYHRSGLPELMGNRLRGAGDDRFHRVADLLLERQGALEQHLRERQASLFNLSRTVLLYDLTNTHFEGLCRQNPKARRGANKQKRNDCAQIVVGMVFDQFGFEMAHKVFEGSLNDGKSLVAMIGQLNAAAGQSAHKPLVVMDAGVATHKNRELLRQQGLGYLVNDSRGQRARYAEQFRQRNGFRVVRGRKGKPPVWVRVLDDPEATQGAEFTERIVLCRSERRAEKERAILSNAEARFLKEVQKLRARVQNNRLKQPAKIETAIGRLQERHRRASRYYDLAVHVRRDGRVQLTCTRKDASHEQATDLQGCYVLRTDEQTLNEHQLWQLYISLTHAEDGFRALKSHLGLRPNPHRREDRVDAHVLLCVLAYHLLRNILWTLEQKGDHRNWETLKRLLRTHCYTTILLPTRNGQTHRIRKAGQPEECQKAIYRNLAIDWRGLPCNRSVFAVKPAQAPNQAPAATL